MEPWPGQWSGEEGEQGEEGAVVARGEEKGGARLLADKWLLQEGLRLVLPSRRGSGREGARLGLWESKRGRRMGV